MKPFWIAAILAFALDQGAKAAVLRGLDLGTRMSIDVLPPYLRFRMGWNRGVNFGLFANDAEVMRWLLVGLAIAVSVWLYLWVRKSAGSTARLFSGLVAGGAIGNALDRVLYGAVADFLNMSCCGLDNPFAFNVADMAIFLGAFGLVLATGRTTDDG